MASHPKSLIEPPQAIEVEAELLGTVLRHSHTFAEVQAMLPEAEYFYHPPNQRIYRAMLDLFRQGELISIETVFAALSSEPHQECKRHHLVELQEQAGAAASVKKQCQVIRDKYLQRETIRQCESVIARCYDGDDVAEVIDFWQSTAFELGKKESSATGFRKLSDDNADYLQRVTDYQSGALERRCIKTGLARLDGTLHGIPFGSLVTIAARTSQGKTQLGLQIAINVAQNDIPAAILSLEMPIAELNHRLHCTISGIDSEMVKRKGQLSEKELRRLTLAGQKGWKMPLHVDDTSSVTPALLLANTRRLKAKYPGLRLVVVDYMQLMNHSTGIKSDTRERVVADISRRLKLMARDLDIVVMGLSQLNEDGASENAKPGLWNLRESKAIGHDSDIVLFCWHYQENGEDKAALVVGKNRQGVSGGIIPMRFEFGQWIDLAPSYRREM